MSGYVNIITKCAWREDNGIIVFERMKTQLDAWG